jgi:hypothetical protein
VEAPEKKHYKKATLGGRRFMTAIIAPAKPPMTESQDSGCSITLTLTLQGLFDMTVSTKGIQETPQGDRERHRSVQAEPMILES